MSEVRKPLLAIAYYTLRTPYEREAEEMLATARAVGLRIQCIGVKNLGDWRANCGFKATFIQGQLARWGPEYRLLYVDVDARFRKYPILLDEIDCDVACHYYQPFDAVNAATLYFNDSEATRECVVRWVRQIEVETHDWIDQIALDKVIAGMVSEGRLKLVKLPVEYAWIDANVSERYHPGTRPVIEQTQASRRYKDVIRPDSLMVAT
jgi:hypothetical protein